MTVRKLIELLKKENQDSKVLAYVTSEQGWILVDMCPGDAVIGRLSDRSKSVVLPAKVPTIFLPWAEEDERSEQYAARMGVHSSKLRALEKEG